MKYEVQENCLTIFLPKDLDHHNAEEIKKEADHLVDRNHIRYIIFDFAETNFMDSSGIGMVIGRYKTMAARGGTVVACGLHPPVDRLFRMAGLHRIIREMAEGGRDEP